jgi:hypothetical protein
MGNQAALIEDVAIDELWINSARPNMGGEELHRCDDVGFLGNSMLTVAPPELLREHLRLDDKALLAPIKPAKIYIDGAETNSSSTTVEAGKMKVLGATFETDSVPARATRPAESCSDLRQVDRQLGSCLLPARVLAILFAQAQTRHEQFTAMPASRPTPKTSPAARGAGTACRRRNTGQHCTQLQRPPEHDLTTHGVTFR